MTSTPQYNPNTPTPQLSYADWQKQFIENFEQLGIAFKQNHVALDDATSANRGNHTYIQMPEQEKDTQTGSQEIAISVKDVSDQADQVFLTYPGNTPIVQYTNYQIYQIKDTFQQSSFFTFLPGKLLVYFGKYLAFNQTINVLSLYPPIAKNLASVNISFSGTTPNYSPATSEFTIFPGGLITGININPPTGATGAAFYLIVANI